MTKEELNELSGIILDAAIHVHKEMGPGLLESVYQYCLAEELESRGLFVRIEYELPLYYKGKRLRKNFSIDLMVENEVIIETKSVAEMRAVFDAQIISYLKLADKKLGFLINFNVPVLKNGFKRFVNNF